ncbi:hypothetical protein LEMLEM_LOCUS5531 [Lemmus lemmus]
MPCRREFTFPKDPGGGSSLQPSHIPDQSFSRAQMFANELGRGSIQPSAPALGTALPRPQETGPGPAGSGHEPVPCASQACLGSWSCAANQVYLLELGDSDLTGSAFPAGAPLSWIPGVQHPNRRGLEAAESVWLERYTQQVSKDSSPIVTPRPGKTRQPRKAWRRGIKACEAARHLARVLSSLSRPSGEWGPRPGRPCSRPEGAALARPPCPRVPPLAAAAPALAPYLELRHPDVGGARPAAPPRLAPARGRRRPAEQPSRASRGRPSPRTPGLRPPRPPTSSQDPQEDAPLSPLTLRAVSLARARTLERGSRGPLATAPQNVPRAPQFLSAPRQHATPAPRSSAAGPAPQIARAGDVGAALGWPGGTGGVPSRSPAAPRGSVSCRSFTAWTKSGRESVARQAPGSAEALGSLVHWLYPCPSTRSLSPIRRSLASHLSISAPTLFQEFSPSRCPPSCLGFHFLWAYVSAFVFSLGD